MKNTVEKENGIECHNGAPASHQLAYPATVENTSKARRSKKRGVFICYCPDAPYEERKFVVELSRQLYEIGLNDDVWFDRDILQAGIESPFCIGTRLDVAEKCTAAILVLSDGFFRSQQTRAEAEILLARISRFTDHSASTGSPVILTAKLGNWEGALEDVLAPLTEDISVDLSVGKISRLSEAEKVSMFISTLNQQLQDVASTFSIRIPKSIDDIQAKSDFKASPLVSWTVADVQDWLASLRIHEKYIISFEEFEIDGFLLSALTDRVLSDILAVDSQICRRKILQRIKAISDEESRSGRFNEWSKERFVRAKSDLVYLIQDPEDEEIGRLLQQDIERKGLKVFSHKSLGRSKEEFLRHNAHNIASSSHVIFLFTRKGGCSPFAFYQLLFAIWLGKSLIVAVFESCTDTARPAICTMLSEFPAIDFATSLYLDGLDLLLNEIKPPRTMSGIVYEQRYLRQMAEGICQFKEILSRIQGMTDFNKAHAHTLSVPSKINSNLQTLKAFVSYQWDHQSKVKRILENLSTNNITCWSDMNHVTKRPITQSLPRTTPSSMSRLSIHENLANEIEKRIRQSNVVLLCLSSSYLQSPNCLKEVSIAASYHKPIIAILLQWLPWPPDSTSYGMRRIFAAVKCIDFSTEKLFAKNLPSLVPQIYKFYQS